MTSFFVSYNRADKNWAEWISWILEEAGHSVVVQAWDFRPGGNFVLDMQRAAAETEKTIAVLSQNYLDSEFTQPEWAAAFAKDPTGAKRSVLPFRVGECQPEGLLGPIVYEDLVGLEEQVAKDAVLNALPNRIKPSTAPPFPSTRESSATQTHVVPPFPPSQDLKTSEGVDNPPDPGLALRLQDRTQKLEKLKKRIEKIDQKIAEGVDFEEEDKLEIRKEGIFQQITQLAQEIRELEG